jgi:hypothetical protein
MAAGTGSDPPGPSWVSRSRDNPPVGGTRPSARPPRQRVHVARGLAIQNSAGRPHSGRHSARRFDHVPRKPTPRREIRIANRGRAGWKRRRQIQRVLSGVTGSSPSRFSSAKLPHSVVSDDHKEAHTRLPCVYCAVQDWRTVVRLRSLLCWRRGHGWRSAPRRRRRLPVGMAVKSFRVSTVVPRRARRWGANRR